MIKRPNLSDKEKEDIVNEMLKNRFFKYTKKEHLDGFLNKGIIRIGTIAEYREGENKEIYDTEEGMTFGIYDQNSGQPAPSHLSYLNRGNSPFDIHYHDNKFTDKVIFENAFVYCMTVVPNEEVMNSFGLENGIQHEMACIEITNIRSFIGLMHQYLIDNSLAYNNFKSKVGFCNYPPHDRNFPLTDEFVNNINNFPDPFFLKPHKLKHQAEFRIVMRAIDETDNLKPVIAQIPELTQYLKLHTF